MRGFIARALRRAAIAGAIATSLACSNHVERPDIALVVIDTVRRDATGIEASRAPFVGATPHLDALARRGTAYPNAWATAPWTVPSHASMLTGELPSVHGATMADPRLDETLETVAERLAAHGYRTAAFFSNPWLSDAASGVLRGFETRVESPVGGLGQLVSAEGDQGASRILENVGRWLGDRDAREPYFLFVNLLEAHLPYDPPADVRASRLPESLRETSISIRWGHAVNAGAIPPEQVDWEVVEALYAADVHTADRWLGRLVAEIEARRGERDTIVLVTSDHGEHLGERGLADHQFSVHEALLAVPLVVAELGGPPPARDEGRVDPRPVLGTDVFATLLELAGLDTHFAPVSSRSLVSGIPRPDRPLVGEYAGPSRGLLSALRSLRPGLDAARLSRAYRTVRVGDFRLTAASDGSIELHDCAVDPTQEIDLAGARPDARASLEALIGGSPTRSAVDGEAPTLDPEVRARLRSLGYVD